MYLGKFQDAIVLWQSKEAGGAGALDSIQAEVNR